MKKAKRILFSMLTCLTIGVGTFGISSCYSFTELAFTGMTFNSEDYIAVTGQWRLGMTTDIVLPSKVHGLTVTMIYPDAFANDNITSIKIPNSITHIGESAFSNCDCLTSIELPDSITYIGKNAFADCENLTIYCEAESQPSGWNSDWNPSNCPVVWGYKAEN